MNIFRSYFHFLFFAQFAFCQLRQGNSIEPVTTIATAITAVAISLGFAGYKYVTEQCDDSWISLDYAGLQDDLESNVFGQHLVTSIVPKSLRAHLNKKKPKKALVMSFHGWTGCGKNHVSQLIVKNLLKNGVKSNYFHLYIGSRDFPHEALLSQYKEQLQRDIEEHSKLCARSVFVFDEVDKMASSVLDALKPYVDYHEQIKGIDYRRNIFIFLSNAGGTNITGVALKFWAEGKNREEISLRDIEPLISNGAFNEVGGLQHSEIVKRDLIDVYVPFLPLEKSHVRECIRAELRNRNVTEGTDKITEDVARQLVYAPKEVELYSVSGCKKIAQKIDIFSGKD